MGGASSPLSSLSQQLTLGVAATVSSTGTAAFTFQNPPQGVTWTGTLNCPAAPPSATFTAKVGATSWGTWAGNTVYGPVQVFGQGGQQLVITATGLTAGTSVEMFFLGTSDPSISVGAHFPDANASALSVAGSSAHDLLYSNAAYGALNGVDTITVPASANYYTTLMIVASAAAAVLGQLSFLVTNTSVLTADNAVAPGLPGNNGLAGIPGGGVMWFALSVRPGDVVQININNTSGSTQTIPVALFGFRTVAATPVLPAPGQPLDVVSYGGGLRASGTFADALSHVVLAAPAGGTAYRVHQIILNGGSGTGVATFQGTSTVNYAVGTPPTAVAVVNLQYQTGFLLTEALNVTWTGNTLAAKWSILYDTVNLPAIG